MLELIYMKYIDRKIEEKIIKAAKTMPIIGITGPRQSGKTTLARNLFREFLYVNLEFPDHRAFAEDDPREFLLQSKKMIIDEVQQAPKLFSYIQGFVDEEKDRQYVLTGSNNFSLMEKISQSLAGRIALFTVLPFALTELRKTFFNHHADASFRGGYPRVLVDDNDPTVWYQGYIQTYLERDVRQMTSIHMMDRFYGFIKILASRAGSVINYAEFSKESGVSINTIRGWFSVLVASYIVYILPPYFSNIKKRLVKAPKFYFYDTGLLSALLGIHDKEGIGTHILSGQIFENFITSEMIKNEYIHHQSHRLFYYRDHDGLEVDLVRERGDRIDLFEIKKGAIYRKEFTKNMQQLRNLFPKVANTSVIYGGSQTLRNGNINLISWKDMDTLQDTIPKR